MLLAVLAKDQMENSLRKHVEVLFDLSQHGRVTGINEPDSDCKVPLTILVRGEKCSLIVYHHDLPRNVTEVLASITEDLPEWSRLQTEMAELLPIWKCLEGWAVGEVESSLQISEYWKLHYKF